MKLGRRNWQYPALAADLWWLFYAYIDGAHRASELDKAPGLASCVEGRRILALVPAHRACVAVHAYSRWCVGEHPRPRYEQVVLDLVRGKLDLTRDQALTLTMAAARGSHASTDHTPNRVVAAALSRHVRSYGSDSSLSAAASELRRSVEDAFARSIAEGRELQVILDALTPAGGAALPSALQFAPAPDDWGRALLRRLRDMPVERRARMNELLLLAASGGRTARPSKRWIEAAEKAIDRDVAAMLFELIDALQPKWGCVTLENQKALRGLIWLAAITAPEGAAQRLETYAANWRPFGSGYELVPANAAIHALAMLPGTTGAASLSRLKRRFKRRGEIKTVDKALTRLRLRPTRCIGVAPVAGS